jgi:hypothetical protein
MNHWILFWPKFLKWRLVFVEFFILKFLNFLKISNSTDHFSMNQQNRTGPVFVGKWIHGGYGQAALGMTWRGPCSAPKIWSASLRVSCGASLHERQQFYSLKESFENWNKLGPTFQPLEIAYESWAPWSWQEKPQIVRRKGDSWPPRVVEQSFIICTAWYKLQVSMKWHKKRYEDGAWDHGG